MENDRQKTIFYKRSNFVAHLPANYLYTASHAWIAPLPDGRHRVGLTKFATRMLGELVDHGFEPQAKSPVTLGQIIGWVEGFKAISDIYCVVEGQFENGNPALKQDLELLGKDPFKAGWLYEVNGTPDPRSLDVQSYIALLDKTIDKILEKQSGEASE